MFLLSLFLTIFLNMAGLWNKRLATLLQLLIFIHSVTISSGNRDLHDKYINKTASPRVGLDSHSRFGAHIESLSLQGGRQVKGQRLVLKEDKTESCPYPYELPLKPEQNLRLFWEIFPAEERIVFCVNGSIKADSLFGFGFSDYGDVKDADFLVMSTDYSGKHSVKVSSIINFLCI